MSQSSLFDSPPVWRTFDLPGAEVSLLEGFVSEQLSFDLYERLRRDIPWRQDEITIYGKTHLVPRLQQWFGDNGLHYTWSGIELQPLPWTRDIMFIKTLVEAKVGKFDSVLANLYRDGDDTVGFHSDDEPDLGWFPTIASVSLGVERDFVLRSNESGKKFTIPLKSGSLLLMGGATQQNYVHSVPRRKRVTEGRVNLTFRNVGKVRP